MSARTSREHSLHLAVVFFAVAVKNCTAARRDHIYEGNEYHVDAGS